MCNAVIIPIGLNQLKRTVYVKFGNPYYVDSSKSWEESALELRDVMATLKWDIYEHIKQSEKDGYIKRSTGDIGYIDEEGFVSLSGRARRVIVRRGFKISAYTIEDKLCEHAQVKECVAVEVDDKDEEHVPMAFIVLQDNVTKEDAMKSILEKCKEELKEYEIPKYFKCVERLPYTQNGKYDFRLLEQMGKEYINQTLSDN